MPPDQPSRGLHDNEIYDSKIDIYTTQDNILTTQERISARDNGAGVADSIADANNSTLSRANIAVLEEALARLSRRPPTPRISAPVAPVTSAAGSVASDAVYPLRWSFVGSGAAVLGVLIVLFGVFVRYTHDNATDAAVSQYYMW